MTGLPSDARSTEVSAATPRWRAAAVIGASSGIGAALADRLVAGGTRVALVARRGDLLEARAAALAERFGAGRAHVVVHDVTQVDTVPSVFRRIDHDLGGLDLVVYAAGRMPRIGWDEYDTVQDRACIEVNLIGAVAWLNEAAEHFRRRGAGTIVGIGSIAGDRGRGGNPAYGASKAAFSHYLESLRHRLRSEGVTVSTIKPGFVDTPMTAGLPGLRGIVSADRAAELILRAAARGRAVAYVPGRWRLVSLVVRAMPSALLARLRL
ncbi:MAG TPA: SDR family NAD(P)-dependent oxidoreductase [Longimicrobiales bacterium]